MKPQGRQPDTTHFPTSDVVLIQGYGQGQGIASVLGEYLEKGSTVDAQAAYALCDMFREIDALLEEAHEKSTSEVRLREATA